MEWRLGMQLCDYRISYYSSRLMALLQRAARSWRLLTLGGSTPYLRCAKAPVPGVRGWSPVVTRLLRVSSVLPASGTLSKEDLEQAAGRVTQLKKDPGNEMKLKLYGLYKQATMGPCTKDRPGMFNLVGRAKWDAWNHLGNLSQEEAIQQYCQLVEELAGSEQKAEEGSEGKEGREGEEYKEIVVTDEGGARTILLNRPAKLNALNYQMYKEVQHALHEAGENEDVVVTVIRGAGDYYCSGNDLSNFAQIPPEGPQKLAAEAKGILLEFVSAFIRFPKPLIAAVNGPAVGVSVTLLGLFDLVYAVEHATFHTPFMELGQSPEGCSSLLFPSMMGGARANEMLLAGRKITAQEACERGLVTRVFTQQEFEERVGEVVRHMASLPPKSLQKSKELLRQVNMGALEEANRSECELLEERWLSEECMKAILAFMGRRKK